MAHSRRGVSRRNFPQVCRGCQFLPFLPLLRVPQAFCSVGEENPGSGSAASVPQREISTSTSNEIGRSGSRRPEKGCERLTSVCDSAGLRPGVAQPRQSSRNLPSLCAPTRRYRILAHQERNTAFCTTTLFGHRKANPSSLDGLDLLRRAPRRCSGNRPVAQRLPRAEPGPSSSSPVPLAPHGVACKLRP